MQLQSPGNVCCLKSVFNFQPHVIVHCAAERRPDVVESQPDAASQLNVAASGNLAKEAGKETTDGPNQWMWFLVKILRLFIQEHKGE